MTQSNPASPCPHCGKLRGVNAHPTLRWVCQACGRPRVGRSTAVLAEPAAVQPLLLLAAQQHRAVQAWQIATLGLGALGVASFAFALLFVLTQPVALGWKLSLAALGFLPLLVAWLTLKRARNSATSVQAHLTRARSLTVATWHQLSSTPLAAPALGEQLGISTEHAEQLLAESEVDEFLALESAAERSGQT